MKPPISLCASCLILICHYSYAADPAEKAAKPPEPKKGKVVSVSCRHVAPHLFRFSQENEREAGLTDRIIVRAVNLSGWLQSMAPNGATATRVQQSLNRFHL